MCHLSRHFFKNFINHVKVKLIYTVGFLKHRDKVLRAYHAFLGIDPSCKSFLITDMIVGCSEDGLMVNLYPFFFQSPVQVLHDIALLIKGCDHGLIEVINMGIISLLVRITSKLGPVTGCTYSDIIAVIVIDTDSKRHSFAAVDILGLFDNSPADFIYALRIRVDAEVVCTESAAVIAAEMIYKDS